MNDYINTPTQQLINDVEMHIDSQVGLSQHSSVLQAFRSLQNISKVVPGFVQFIAEQLGNYSSQTSLNQRELALIEIHLILRTLSTYAAIPTLVGQLQLIGEFEAVERINSNAIDEGGGKGNPSHHELLNTSLSIVAHHLGGIPVTTKRLAAAIQIYELRKTNSDYETLKDDALWEQLMADNQYLPIQKEELPLAVEIAGFLNDDILRYHRHIQKTILVPAMMHPFNKKLLALATLELAKREAESVDEKDGNLSFIGAWEQLTQSFQNSLSPDELKQANAWAAAHNDEEEARKAGWQDRSAEDGHARDAREVALYFLRPLNPVEFAEVLEQVTENARLRLQHWDYLVASLNELRSTSDYQSESSSSSKSSMIRR